MANSRAAGHAHVRRDCGNAYRQDYRTQGTGRNAMKKKANSYTLFFVITLLLAWAAGLILFAVSTTRMTPVLTDERTDAIIVLTGGSRRINTGLQLFAEGKSDQLFISGVNSGVSLNDIENMHKGSELPECCISIGYQANNTMNNAAES